MIDFSIRLEGRQLWAGFVVLTTLAVAVMMVSLVLARPDADVQPMLDQVRLLLQDAAIAGKEALPPPPDPQVP